MLQEVQDLFAYHSHKTVEFAKHDVNNVFKKTLHDLKLCGFGNLEGKRVLDLGCGQRYAFALQCAAKKAKVTALDINYVQPVFLPVAFMRTLRRNGLKRTLKSTARRLLFDNAYYHHLESFSNEYLLSYKSEIDFVVADPTKGNYPLPSNSFDLIASNAVVEHIPHVPKFAQEIKRLLALNGCFYAIIHNYYSLSGGHNLEWEYPDESPSTKVPPWDHLRDNRFPAFTYLNRYKPAEYREIFETHLRVLLFEGRDVNHDPGRLEGESLLTDDLLAELGYSKELLLTRAWCIVCKKV
jgi:SAM-dependent methyltransferase